MSRVVHLKHVSNYTYNRTDSSLEVSWVEKNLRDPGVLWREVLRYDENAFQANLTEISLKSTYEHVLQKMLYLKFNGFVRPH